MASQSVKDLEINVNAAHGNLSGQLRGLEPHLERSDAPGEWTAREVLSHVLFPPGFDPVVLLKTFADRDLPLVEITPGERFALMIETMFGLAREGHVTAKGHY